MILHEPIRVGIERASLGKPIVPIVVETRSLDMEEGIFLYEGNPLFAKESGICDEGIPVFARESTKTA